MSIDTIARKANARLRDGKAGSLRMWGEWFSKPYDSIHTMERYAAENMPVQIGGPAID